MKHWGWAYAQHAVIIYLCLRVLFQKHALPRLARVLGGPLLNDSGKSLAIIIGEGAIDNAFTIVKWATLTILV